jgi:subtilisin family serine protease
VRWLIVVLAISLGWGMGEELNVVVVSRIGIGIIPISDVLNNIDELRNEFFTPFPELSNDNFNNIEFLSNNQDNPFVEFDACPNLAIAVTHLDEDRAREAIGEFLDDETFILSSDGRKTLATNSHHGVQVKLPNGMDEEGNAIIRRLQDINQTGNGVIVAIIDTGITPPDEHMFALHQDSVNLVDFNQDTMDKSGHGTVIATITNSVAFGADILSISACEVGEGNIPNCFTDKVIIGICHAVDIAKRNEVDLVINLSMSGQLKPNGAIKTVINQILQSEPRRTIVVTSTGNSQQYSSAESSCEFLDTPDVVYPAPAVFNTGIDGLITVASLDNQCPGDFIDVAAPGTVQFNGDIFQGSSFAAPWVTGTVALMLEQSRSHSAGFFHNSEIEACLKNTARLSDHSLPLFLDGNFVGAGLIHANDAIVCSQQ